MDKVELTCLVRLGGMKRLPTISPLGMGRFSSVKSTRLPRKMFLRINLGPSGDGVFVSANILLTEGELAATKAVFVPRTFVGDPNDVIVDVDEALDTPKLSRTLSEVLALPNWADFVEVGLASKLVEKDLMLPRDSMELEVGNGEPDSELSDTGVIESGKEILALWFGLGKLGAWSVELDAEL